MFDVHSVSKDQQDKAADKAEETRAVNALLADISAAPTRQHMYNTRPAAKPAALSQQHASTHSHSSYAAAAAKHTEKTRKAHPLGERTNHNTAIRA